MQRNTMTEIVNHSRNTAWERSVKILLGSLNRFFVVTTLALSSAVVYTRHLFSPCERFRTPQCNISENIKIKQIRRRNNGEDSTNTIWNKCSSLAINFGSAFLLQVQKQVLGEENISKSALPSFSCFFTVWGTHTCTVVSLYICSCGTEEPFGGGVGFCGLLEGRSLFLTCHELHSRQN